jgi:imidazolonepropionase-like amidohydrolase
VASVEHAILIDAEAIELAKQHGTYLDLDIYDDECIQEQGRAGSMAKDFLKHDREPGHFQRENLRKAVKAGAKMSFGTDAGFAIYGTAGKQFAFMVRGAAVSLGSVVPGKYEDMIAVALSIL